MPQSFVLTTAQELTASRSAIESFYCDILHHHQLPRSPELTLSALELRPVAYDTTLVIIPGRAETEHKYAELLYSLQNWHCRILVLFVRGQGDSTRPLTGSPKCHIDDFNLYRNDVEFMLDALDVTSYRLMGFSLGGLICTDLYVNGQHKPQRLALMAPYFWPAFKLPEPVLKGFVLLMGSLPGFKLAYTPHGSEYQKIDFAQNIHSHSKIRYEFYHDYYAAHPDKALAGPTYAFVRQALLKQLELRHRRFEFTIPVFCATAGDDRVVSTPHCAALMQAHAHDQMPPQYVRVSGAYHDLLNESDDYRNPILSRALSFLTA